jgi:hypothetical protein
MSATHEEELKELIYDLVKKACTTNLPRLCSFAETEEGKQTATQMIFDYCIENAVSVQTAMAHIDSEL